MCHNSSDKDAVFLVLLLYTNTVDFHSSNIYWLKCRFSELQIHFYKLNHWLKISFMARFPCNFMINNKYYLHPSSLYTLLIFIHPPFTPPLSPLPFYLSSILLFTYFGYPSFFCFISSTLLALLFILYPKPLLFEVFRGHPVGKRPQGTTGYM